MKELTIIIPFLNEGVEPVNTINSINETSDIEFINIILIDDGSDELFDINLIKNFKNVQYIKNNNREGTGYCINYALNFVETPYVLIIDAHMRFLNDNCSEKIVNTLKNNDKTLICTKSFAIDEDNKHEWDINKNIADVKGQHNGAYLIPYYRMDDGFVVLFDARWKDLELDKGEIYDIHSVMGACYASSTEWLKYIKSTKGLKMWGSIEETLSLKTWLAGGSVKLLTTTGIGHIYRKDKPPYTTNYDYVLFNKLWLVYTLFDDSIVYKLFNLIRDDDRYKNAFELLNKNIIEAKIDREYYKSIFINDHIFLKKIGIDIYDERFSNIINIKNNIIDINNELDIFTKSLDEYNKQLSELDNLKINQQNKNTIKQHILKHDIPNIKNRIKNINNKKTELENKLKSLLPTKSVFGFDV